jgi:hypothetical protein
LTTTFAGVEGEIAFHFDLATAERYAEDLMRRPPSKFQMIA